MRTTHRIALILIIIGAINWGLIGFFKFDLVGSLFGGQTALFSRIIFGLVGISGLICLPLLFEPARDVGVERGRQGYRKLNYETEFSEEADFTDIKEYPKQHSDEKK